MRQQFVISDEKYKKGINVLVIKEETHCVYCLYSWNFTQHRHQLKMSVTVYGATSEYFCSLLVKYVRNGAV